MVRSRKHFVPLSNYDFIVQQHLTQAIQYTFAPLGFYLCFVLSQNDGPLFAVSSESIAAKAHHDYCPKY